MSNGLRSVGGTGFSGGARYYGDLGRGHTTGSGGGGSDMLEARVAKLEATAEHIDKTLSVVQIDVRDVRREVKDNLKITVGALAFVAIGLAGIMASGFGWL